MSERYIETLRLMTQAWQCDHLGHVNVSFYMGWLGDAAFAALAMHGLSREQCTAEGLGVAAVRAEIDYRSELRGGDMVRMETTIEGVAERKMVFRHRLVRVGDERVAMTAKLIAVCMDLTTRKSRAFPPRFIECVASAFAIQPTAAGEVAA